MRSVAIALLGLACAGCADGAAGALGLKSGAMHLAGPGSAATAEDADASPHQKTLASKVMSAIALEKVTGRKPDPGRLMQLD